MRSPSLTILAIPALLVAAALTAGPARAATCIKSTFACESTTTLSAYTDEPTIVCPNGDTVVEIVSSAVCTGGSAGPVTVYRCSSSTDGFSYAGGGYTHQFKPKHGNWGDVLAGNCAKLSYVPAP